MTAKVTQPGLVQSFESLVLGAGVLETDNTKVSKDTVFHMGTTVPVSFTDFIKTVRKCGQIQALHIRANHDFFSHCHGFEDRDLCIPDMKNITKMILRAPRSTDSGQLEFFTMLKKLPQLKEVDFELEDTSYEALSVLALLSLTVLKVKYEEAWHLSSRNQLCLTRWNKSLEHIEVLSYSPFSDIVLESISRDCPHLRFFSNRLVNHTTDIPPTQKGLLCLAKLEKLESLEISAADHADETVIDAFANHKRLRYVDFVGCAKITEEVVKKYCNNWTVSYCLDPLGISKSITLTLTRIQQITHSEERKAS